MKADCAVFSSASARIVIDTIWIRGTISGLLKTLFPIRSERRKVTRDSVVPMIISNVVAAAKTVFRLFFWFSWLYFAVYLIVDSSIPRSLKVLIRFGAIRAIEYIP